MPYSKTPRLFHTIIILQFHNASFDTRKCNFECKSVNFPKKNKKNNRKHFHNTKRKFNRRTDFSLFEISRKRQRAAPFFRHAIFFTSPCEKSKIFRSKNSTESLRENLKISPPLCFIVMVSEFRYEYIFPSTT